jgi:hypothetical protein
MGRKGGTAGCSESIESPGTPGARARCAIAPRDAQHDVRTLPRAAHEDCGKLV